MPVLEFDLGPLEPGPLDLLLDDELVFPPEDPEMEAATSDFQDATGQADTQIGDQDHTIRVTVTEQLNSIGKCFRDVFEALKQIPDIIKADPDEDMLAIESILDSLEKPLLDFEDIVKLVPEDIPPPPPPPPPPGGDGTDDCPPGEIRLPDRLCGKPLFQ